MDRYKLKLRQALPLEDKVKLTKKRIHDWIEYFGLGYIYIF